MKTTRRKNQIMIGALALMIAVAGYLNFSADKVSKDTLADMSTGEDVIYDLSEEDLLQKENMSASVKGAETLDEPAAAANKDYIDGEMSELVDNMVAYDDAQAAEEFADGSELAIVGENVYEDEIAADGAADAGELAERLTIDDIPGEAVFTGGNSITSLASARLLKEQTRAMNREALLDVINSSSADESSRQQATEGMLALTKRAEKETAAEILLEAKGYPEVVVSLSEDSADVVVGMSQLTNEQCAQIIDAVARKTEVPASQIVITPAGAGR